MQLAHSPSHVLICNRDYEIVPAASENRFLTRCNRLPQIALGTSSRSLGRGFKGRRQVWAAVWAWAFRDPHGTLRVPGMREGEAAETSSGRLRSFCLL